MTTLLKRLIVVSLFLLTLIPIAAQATSPQPGVNGYTNQNSNTPKTSSGYVPPNVQDAQKQQAERKQKEQQKKAESEDKIEKDKSYPSIEDKAENIEQTLDDENASTEDLEQAGKDLEEVKQYIADHKEEESANQIKGLEQTQRNYEEKAGEKLESAQKREEAQDYLQNAREAENPSEMSKLTSYLYVQGGFFNTDDLWPKAINAIAQGFFFVTKAIYCLVIIIFQQVFTKNPYQSLDEIVSFSANFFQTFMADYQYLVYGLALVWAVKDFFKTRKFPFHAFRFLLVWFLALFLYQQSTLPLDYGNSNITATYNLSRIIKAVDGLGQDMTKAAIAGFDKVDETSAGVQGGERDNLTAIKETIFDQLVYQPFLAMNFKDLEKFSGEGEEGQEKLTEKVTDLFTTGGKQDGDNGVEKFAKENSDIEQLSFEYIGIKFFTAVASTIKALVVGVSLIVIGLIALVFRYLTLILLVVGVILLLVAMLPSCGQVLTNASKKVFQFTLLGSLGLFAVRAFLFVNSLIEQAAGGMTKQYFWVAIIQGLVWFILYKVRHLLGGLFVQGTLSAMELARKAQSGFDRFTGPHMPGMNRLFAPTRTLGREAAAAATVPALSKLTAFGTAARTLFRAGTNGTAGFYDDLRYGKDQNLDKAAAQQARADFKARLQDQKEGLQDFFTLPKAEGFRAKVHDLAGDTDTPVQKAYQERQNRRRERLERRETRREQAADFDRFRDERRRTSATPPTLKNSLKEHLAVPRLKREFRKEQLKESQTLTSSDPEAELFEKGEKK